MTILSHMIQGYITAMLWSSNGTDQEGNDLESLEGFELSSEAETIAKADCEKFLKENKNLLSQVYNRPADYESAGHDFWLTRNGHGVGFWDRGFGVVGDALTDRAKEYKEQSPCIGDDGKIYL